MNKYNFTHYRIVFALIFAMIFSGCVSTTPKPAHVNCLTVDALSMQGTIKGTWKGIAMHIAEVSGDFSITIAPDGKITGTYTGSISGDITGCIDSTGNIQASGTVSDGVIAWIGMMDKSSGKLTARGTWIFGSGSGTWSGQK